MILLEISNNLIPIIAIMFGCAIPIVAIYTSYKQKENMMAERKLMIEKGLTPPTIEDKALSLDNKNYFSRGINLLAITLGLVTGYIMSRNLDIDDFWAYLCCVLFWLGIANILKGLLMNNENIKNK